MKLVVFSDSHGRYSALEAVLAAHPDAELYIHLGDGYEQATRLRQSHPTLPIVAVRGNCDRLVTDSDTKLYTVGGKRILCTHGHRFGVKQGLAALRQEARRQNADLVLFGHTHRPFCEETEGILYLNPGSAGSTSGIKFALVEIDETGGLHPSLERMDYPD